MKIYNELESLGFFKWLSETHNLVDTDMESEYLDKLPLNDIHRTVCNSMAFRWFREKYFLHHVIHQFEFKKDTDEEYLAEVNNTDNGFSYFRTYEEAEFFCIDKLIEIVKNK